MDITSPAKCLSIDKYILTLKVCNKIILLFSRLDTLEFIENLKQLFKLERALSENLKFSVQYLEKGNSIKLNDSNIYSSEISFSHADYAKEAEIDMETISIIPQPCQINYPDTLCENQIKIKKFYPCKVCNKMLTSEKFFNRHIRLCSRQKVNCKICDKFLPRRYFKTHLARHLNVRKHKCAICYKAFLEAKDLDQHMLTHGVVRKTHLCVKCGQKFNDHRRLHKHDLEVHMGRRYACHSCDKLFLRHFDLKRHLIRHKDITA